MSPGCKKNFATTALRAGTARRQLAASLAPAVTAVRAPRLDRMACDRLADRCAAAAARHELTGHLPCAAHRWRKRSWSSTSTMAAAGCWWCLSIMNNPVMMHLNHPSSLDALALVGEVGVQASSHSQPFSSSPSLHATHASRHDMCCACTTRIQYTAGAPALAAVLVVTMQQPARRSYPVKGDYPHRNHKPPRATILNTPRGWANGCCVSLNYAAANGAG